MPNYDIKDLVKYAQDLGYNVKANYIITHPETYIITFTETSDTYAVKYYSGILEGADHMGFYNGKLSFFGSKRISVNDARELLYNFTIKKKELIIEQKKKSLKQDFK